MRAKISNWFDTVALKELYGVKVFYKQAWRNLSVDGKPFITESKEEAKTKCKELHDSKQTGKLVPVKARVEVEVA